MMMPMRSDPSFEIHLQYVIGEIVLSQRMAELLIMSTVIPRYSACVMCCL